MNERKMLVGIKRDFGDLFKASKRGELVEIVTPLTTLEDDFVSVFIRKSHMCYTVHDDGWLDSEGVIKSDVEQFLRAKFGVLYEQADGTIRIFHKDSTEDMLSNAVFDMAHFIQAVFNQIIIERRMAK